MKLIKICIINDVYVEEQRIKYNKCWLKQVIPGDVISLINPHSSTNEQKKLSAKLRIFSYPSILTCVLGAQKNRLATCFLVEKQENFELHTDLSVVLS